MTDRFARLISGLRNVAEFALNARRALFIAVLGALIIDLVVFFVLGWFGVRPEKAQFVGGIFAAAFFARFDPLIGNWLIQIGSRGFGSQYGVRVAGLAAVALFAVSLRSPLFNITLSFDIPLVVVAIILSGVSFLLLAWLRRTLLSTEVTEFTIAWCAIVALFVLRLLYIGLPELIPEEAYYWLYSQNLALGYLDHPPMVGWLIAFGEAVFGTTEFGVRFSALFCWLIGAGFLFKMASDQFDRATAIVTLALYSALPFFFGVGVTIAPDAPLVAAWVAALYFLRLALVDQRSNAWFGFGIAVGLGMLSKYTIVLLGPAVLLFMILHSPARQWLRRPQPYIAAFVALLIFSPVLYWNATHAWASFMFQGPRRMAMPSEFALHQLLLDILVLITPSAAIAILAILFVPRTIPSQSSDRRFVFACAIVPIAVFTIYSLRHETKLNWTGPAFLGLLPCIAAQILGATRTAQTGWRLVLIRSWVPTTMALAVSYGVLLQLISFGLPVIGYPPKAQRFLSWNNLAMQVSERAQVLAQSHGSDPWIVGMDKHYIASELAFYLGDPASRFPVTSRQIFGRDALMFHFWNPESAAVAGRNMILVARNESDLSDELVKQYFVQLDPIEKIVIIRDGEVVGSYYLRTGLGFSTAGATGS